MTRILVTAMCLALCGCSSFGQNKPEASAQIQRGRSLFEKSSKGLPCATCHALDGVGTDIAPDLRRLGALVTPRDLMRSIDMQQTVFVQEVQTAKLTFPGLQRQIHGETIEIWDLSLTPPLLRSLRTADIVSMRENRKWGHPPAYADYTIQEMADIIGFIKWVANGGHRDIYPADLK